MRSSSADTAGGASPRNAKEEPLVGELPNYAAILDYHETPAAGELAGGGYFGQHAHPHHALHGRQEAEEELERIPFQCPTLGARERELVLEVLASGQLTQAGKVLELEAEFARHAGGRYAVACNSGTAALHLGLLARGVGPGDAVLVPALTYIATANAVAYTGARVLVTDVDPVTWTMDPASAARMARGAREHGLNVAAAVPVSLCGTPADIGALRAALGAEVWLLEDAAQAIGSHGLGRGDAAAYSLHGSKTITAGEGGILITGDGELAARARLYRGQGFNPALRHRYIHSVLGYNYRLPELSAAIALAQLERLPELLERRRQLTAIYVLELGACLGVSLQGEAPGHTERWCIGVTTPALGSDVVRELERRGIETRPMFYPIHRQPGLKVINDRVPVAEVLADTGVLLPLHGELDFPAVARIVRELADVVDGLDGGR